MNQEPNIHIAPEWHKTHGQDADAFGSSFGIALDPWQKFVMDDWLAIDDDHKWVCSTCGLSVPRQNGKTALVKVRVMYGIFVLGETILFTCHEVRTSRQVFDSLADILNPNGEFPELAAQVQYIKRSNGYEEIKVADWQDEDREWHKGGKLLFSSRSKGASRGFTADVVVADEAMYMTDEQVAALVPTMASASGGDMQFIMLGTPPSPGDVGTVFESTRNAAKNGEKGISWCEWGADEIGDVHDWDRIARFNPSLDKRLMRKAVENELAVMAPDTFARERLGWWSPVSERVDHIFDAKAWDACATDDEPHGTVCYGVKLSPDGSEAALSACWQGDAPHFELVDYRDTRRGVGWLADWLDARADKCAMLAVDGRNADALTSRLENYRARQLHVMRTSDAIAAAALMLDGIRSGTVTHYGQAELDEQAKAAVRRKVGRDAWCIGGEHSTAIESAACALWAAKNAKYKPGRKARIG